MKPLSIRQRLTVWYALVLLLGLGLFASGMWLALRIRLLAEVDQRLEQRLRGVERAGADGDMPDREHVQRELSEFAAEYPDGGLIQLRDGGGAVIVPVEGQAPFSSGAGAPRTVDREGKRYRVAVANVDFGGKRYEALAASPLDEIEAMLRDFRSLLLLVIPAVLGCACMGGYWLSGRALKPLEESVKRMRQFTADASHELRTPIALIRASAELALRRERAGEAYRESLRSIEAESERMTELAERLLLLARADSDALELKCACVDLNRVVMHAVKQHEALAAQKGIRLRGEDAGAAAAYADESAVYRLLLILLDNALKHTPAGGSVTAAARACEGGVELSVADTGEGIAPDALPRIFERFYRCDEARGWGSGFGLGLSIAQAIAQAHGTEIRVESALGKGSRFRLVFRL